MPGITTLIFYVLIFLSMYVQVFLLVTYLERRKELVYRKGAFSLSKYPSVTVIVPCWNEEQTLDKTVQSLFELDYPKEQLKFFLVDDGSTDSTWQLMQKYSTHPQVEIFKKENGGKHTAVNYGIEQSDSEFVSCLDADSFVHPQALKRMMTYFFRNPKTMAVTPSIIIYKPKNMMQAIQKVEYDWAVYIKKMLAFLGAIHVTPGPFSVYKREIFERIGLFRKAHNTEDMEIAYRMQKNHLPIEQCNDAFVYTVAPDTVKKLYKQRLRWIYGFIKNTIDYRGMLFKKEYGTFAFFTVPSGVVSIIAVPYVLVRLVSSVVEKTVSYVEQVSTVGFNFSLSGFHFEWFYINTPVFLFFVVMLYAMVFTAMVIGKYMAEGNSKLSYKMVLFMAVYSIIAPVWVVKAMYNTVMAKKTSWR